MGQLALSLCAMICSDLLCDYCSMIYRAGNVPTAPFTTNIVDVSVKCVTAQVEWQVLPEIKRYWMSIGNY